MSTTPLPSRNLDVLRAVAVLSVAAAHFVHQFTDHIGPMSVWDMGRLGVLLFFVHTALVLMSSIERSGTDGSWARDFYIRRAFRIYPLAIVAIIAYQAFRIPPSVVPGEANAFTQLGAADLASNIALTQNLHSTPLPIGVLWSLPIEVQMYLALPLCFLVARAGVRGVLALMAISGFTWLVGHELPGFWRLTVVMFAPCFLSGVLAYAVLRRRRPMAPSWVWVLALAAVITLAALLNPTDTNPAMNWLVCLAVGLAIPFVRDLPVSRFTRACKVICEYSYGIYLVHIAALHIAFVLGAEWPLALRCAVFFAATALLSFVGYHAVEKPGIAMGKRLTQSRPTTSAVTAPAP